MFIMVVVYYYLRFVLYKNIFFFFYLRKKNYILCFFFFQAEDGIRDLYETGVQTCALPIFAELQPQRVGRSRVDGFEGFVGLLQEVRAERRVGLLAVPGASARPAQAGHDRDQSV